MEPKQQIEWVILIFLVAVSIGFLILFYSMSSASSSEGNDVRTYHEDYKTPSPPVRTTVSPPEPIIGHWSSLNDTTEQTINITIERFGSVTKWKKDNGNFSFIRGPWKKVSEDRYLIQWQAEVDLVDELAVVRATHPPDETIIYNLSSDSINVNNSVYSRNTVAMKNNSDQKS